MSKRFAGVLMAILLVAPPALAQSAAPGAPKPIKTIPIKPDAPKPATPAGAPRDTIAALPLSDRMALQSDLVWTGDYNGLVEGEISERTIAAIKAFQKRRNTRETGLLDTPARAALATAAKTQQTNVGWRLADDPITGARLGMPEKLAPQTGKSRTGSRWSAAKNEVQIETFRYKAMSSTLAALFEREKREPPERTTAYSVLRDSYFVVSGTQDARKFYIRAQARDGEVRGVSIFYKSDSDKAMDRVVVAMSSAFAPFHGPAIGPASPPPRRSIEYGTAVAVSASGDFITDRDLTGECAVIVVPGLGHADRIAEDEASGLALLRVHGAKATTPLPLAKTSATGAVTLAGIADPQTQSGGSASSILRARLDAKGLVDPVPPLGFSGAAAIGDDGLRALVRLDLPQTAGTAPVVPIKNGLTQVAAVQALLAAQGITPVTGRVSEADAKASLARVICVRK
jgi:peptidoglycan hydrolase-like protein with peptidoglycan-binding domain